MPIMTTLCKENLDSYRVERGFTISFSSVFKIRCLHTYIGRQSLTYRFQMSCFRSYIRISNFFFISYQFISCIRTLRVF